jgi:streptomycin 6-kinase
MNNQAHPMLNHYLTNWRLTPDGESITTHSSILVPVRHDGTPAMLKLATGVEERRGANVMVWWNGDGAARVLAHEGDALLMERATGHRSLIDDALNSHDDEATRIICAAVARLHAPRPEPYPSSLVPLPIWFQELDPAAKRYGGIFRQSATAAKELLAEPREIVALHGDVHHGNILDFGERGWLAIDPKGLLGERGFDYANTFCNPDEEVATAPGRLARQAAIVAESANLDRTRLLRWILAYAGLSAAWSLSDGDDSALAITIAGLAASELAQAGQLNSASS